SSRLTRRRSDRSGRRRPGTPTPDRQAQQVDGHLRVDEQVPKGRAHRADPVARAGQLSAPVASAGPAPTTRPARWTHPRICRRRVRPSKCTSRGLSPYAVTEGPTPHRAPAESRQTMAVPTRLPNTAQTSLPWRIHELTQDFRLEDVWALPTPGGAEDFHRL